MFTSGSELISNPGNAALGYSGGVQYGGNPNANPLAGVNTILGQVQQQEYAASESRRQRAIQQQEKLAQDLAMSGVSLFNMKGQSGGSGGPDASFVPLDADKEILMDRANDIRKRTLLDPQGYQYDADLLKKKEDATYLNRLANLRAVDIAQKKILLSKTNNPDERARIQASIDETVNTPLTDYKMPSPYVPSVTSDLTKVWSPEILSGKGKDMRDDITVKVIDQDGNEVEVVKSGIRASALDKRKEWMGDTAAFNEARNYVSSLYNTPDFWAPDKVAELNGFISQYNTDRGFKPGDPHYAPQIAEVFVTADGPKIQRRPLDPTNIADMMYSIGAAHAGQLDASQELKRTASQIAKEKEQMDLNKQRVQQGWANVGLRRKELALKAEKAKGTQKRAMQDASEVMKLLDTGNRKAEPIKSYFADLEKTGLAKGLMDEVIGAGNNVEDFKVHRLRPNDQFIRNMAGVQYVKPNGELQKAVSDIEQAAIIYPKNGNPNDARFVFSYSTYEPVFGPNGEIMMKGDEGQGAPMMKKVQKWKAVTASDAIRNIPISMNNFGDLNEKDRAEMEESINYFDDVMGGGFGDEEAQSSPAQQTQKQPPVQSKIKVGTVKQIGGKSYIYAADGWHVSE